MEKRKKMTKDDTFKQDYNDLFSKRRMDSYADEQEYSKNLELIEFLTPKLCLFEVFVRNKILEHPSIKDKTAFILREITRQKQAEPKPPTFLALSLRNFMDDIKKPSPKTKLFLRINKILTLLTSCQDFIEKQELETDKLISSQSMGFWASIIDSNKNIRFLSDRNFLSKASSLLDITTQSQLIKSPEGVIKKKKLSRNDTLSYIQTTDNRLDWVVLFLVKNLRNRAFHWENLLKEDDKGHSRISVSLKIPEFQKKTIISIKKECIKDFMKLCLDACDNRLNKIYGK